MLGASTTTFLGASLPLDLGFVGAQGCPLSVSAELIVPLTHANGTASWILSILNTPLLIGGVVHQQARVFESGANALGAITSNAGTATIGL